MKKVLGYVASVAALFALGGCASTSAQGSKTSVKTVSTAKQIKLRTNYHKNAQKLEFKNGRKNAKLTVLNGKKQCVKKFSVANKGNFDIKLSKAQAKKLSQCKTFKYAVAQKGYKTYTVSNPVCK
ncbi:hypothetical protein [Levilactobacillus namurensis]|uniref:Lipoprotein n=1 Tax=Levilactobacillus namurensis TaxID=380393 RepID=A0AAW8W620_9LACO|nr:hypothetical protein [Levilactobacillus namurensis]PTM24039.1 hypothetical protein DA798_02125 [Lactobacillus sp. PFC-70]MCW3778241.1 hypothetical protein [Levilactobacillus namurensis]MDT7013864.1 hypothetical protein [Levilactobacillus namurensis]MDT7019209.1 hypothetical protein [Levilactobacillus namurensis]WNN66187.1 hypothetical protein RIN67_03570 [Levilactobacillus namurensis]